MPGSRTVRRLGWLAALFVLCASSAGVAKAAEGDSLNRQAVSTSSAPRPLSRPGQDETVRVSMEFQNVSIKEILKAFSLQTGLNIIAGGDVGDETMTLYLEDVTVLDALDQILKAGKLSYEHPPGSDIFIVSRQPDEARTITRVYRLKYARVSKAILTKSAAAFGMVTPFEAATSTANATGGSAPGASSSSGASADNGVGVDSIIRQLLTDQGKVVVDERTNSLIVTDVPENFDRIEAAIVALDAKTPQILVDVEFVETIVGKIRDLGIEWGTGEEGNLVTFTPGRKYTRAPFNWLGRAGAPTQVTYDGSDPFNDDSSLDQIRPSSSNFTLSRLDAREAKAVLQALETDSQTKVLARPKVLTLDNESAIIRLSTNQAVGFEVTTDATTGTTTSEAKRETTGIILSVTPQVNADGYITMLVEPSITKVVPAEVTPPDSSTVVDPKTRSSRTMVRIKDGYTLVVGGLIDRSNDKSVRKVPFLSGIPVIGKAFEDTQVNNSTTELIVFVTPKIVPDSLAEMPAPSAGKTLAWSQAVAAVGQEKGVEPRESVIDDTLSAFEQRDQPRTSR